MRVTDVIGAAGTSCRVKYNIQAISLHTRLTMKGILKDMLKKGDSKLTATNLLDQMSVFIAGWILREHTWKKIPTRRSPLSVPHFTVKGGHERGDLQLGIFFPCMLS